MNSKSMYDRCEEASDNHDDNIALEDIGRERKKRGRGKKRSNHAPPSKKRKQIFNDDTKVELEVKITNEVAQDPKMVSKVMTQNYFSIFNTNSKFKNAPGKVAKKPRVKNVDASKKRKIRIVEGIKSLNEYFTTLVGNEDEADEKGLDSQSVASATKQTELVLYQTLTYYR